MSGPRQETFLDPATVRLRREGADLVARIGDGEPVKGLRLLRALPLSEPGRWFSLRDGEDKEVGMLRDLAGLDAEGRAAAGAELARRYFQPRILRIAAAKKRREAVEWKVETDRGPRTFLTREMPPEDDQPSPDRLVLTDTEGNRYEIASLSALDAHSRARLEAHR